MVDSIGGFSQESGGEPLYDSPAWNQQETVWVAFLEARTTYWGTTVEG